MNDIQQMRLVNGTEIVANILHWDDDTNIEVNYALIMEVLPEFGDEEEYKSYYVLKPLVSYTDDLAKPTVINPGAVMVVSEPSPTVIKQYKNSIKDISSQLGDNKDSGEKSVSNVLSFAPKKGPELLNE